MTVFGNKGDIQLNSLAVVRDHCKVRYSVVRCGLVRCGAMRCSEVFCV